MVGYEGSTTDFGSIPTTSTTTLLTSQTTNIINYLITNKYTNGTSVMGQVFTIVVMTFFTAMGEFLCSTL